MKHGLIFNLSNYPTSSRPLGPYRIAHFLRENNFDIEVIEYALFWKLEELQEFARSRINQNTIFIASSHLFYAYSDTIELFFKWIKQCYPKIVIISGSAAFPGFESSYIDYYIRGYGEFAILNLLKYVEGNGEKPILDLNFLVKGKKVINAIHSYPSFPMKSLLVKYENRDFLLENEWLGIEFSRGCKFKCAFCNYPILGIKDDYTRDAEDSYVQLMDTYDRFGITKYIISDDTFNDRTEKITKFANVTERLSFSPWYWGFIRADLLTLRNLDSEELCRMGVNGHYYGIESFNHPSAKSIGKGLNPERLKSGIIKNKDYFKNHSNQPFRATIGLIVGLPYETFETLNQTKKWLIDNWQGQSFVSWGLEIYNPDGVENLSTLSLDYKKYGYQRITDKAIQDKAKSLIPKMYHKMGDRFIWENSNMNFLQAQEYAINMSKDLYNQYDFRPLSNDLFRYQLSNQDLTFEEICNRSTRVLNTNFDDQNFVNQYIFKKLSSF